jgi:transcriptional regulator with XRE-family HTH domain
MGSAFPEEYRRFVKKLKAARIEAGLTQVDVAHRLKKPQSFISKFETGERRIDPVELRHLAEIYGKALADLL